MVDFAEWTRRACAFLRGLTWLPGRIDIHDFVHPPANDSFDREWLTSGRCSVPPEIRFFLSSASCWCCFSYEWTPPPENRRGLAALFPNQQTLIGGGNFCEAAKYSNYDNRDGFAGPLDATTERIHAERSKGRFPLMELPNGDTISLQLETSDGTCPVVYIGANATTEQHILSESFEQFLLDWERLCYIQPSLEYLAPWIDSASGRLNLDKRETDVLSDLLSSSSAK